MIYGRNAGSRIVDQLIIILLILIAMASIFPVLHVFAVSFSEKAAVSAAKISIWPVGFNLHAYQALLLEKAFFVSFGVSIKRVLLGAAIQFLLTVLMAYPLSKEVRQFRARNYYMWLLVFCMLFSGGLIPWFITINSLGLIDTIWALVLPGAVPIFSVILLMNFFRGLPRELDEAGAMDGAGQWYLLFRVFVPLSLPALATVTLFSIVGHWNSFFDGLVLMGKPEHQPLQTYLNVMIVQQQLTNLSAEQLIEMSKISNKTLNAAKIVVSMLPIILLYPFLQRFFIHGIVLGSIKE